ncbi:MAG TPA: RNA 2',3'-cyclic phosphodiesterase [Candidatus Dormibacteraeota bacterium]|nr:RNA 2',3'-cyclic phosphodiesterase [Candidatus Dormibacteraeota bacterium]
MSSQNLVRAFFGLPLPETHRPPLERFLARCGALAPEFRWTPAINLHLTVRFLGHVELELAEGIADRVAATGPFAFELQLGELGTFKRGRLARVVWLGLSAGAREAGALAELVEAECVRAGLEPDGRRFNAHLTLARARARDGSQLPALPDPPDLPSWRASDLILYRSRLGRGGSVYEPLRLISLR